MGLWSKKKISEIHSELSDDDSPHSLKRSLGLFNLIMIGIGGIIGAGIFVLTGTAAANYAGPAISISFVIAGIGCLCAGLCYAEFASMIPVSGSAYSYAYATMGEFLAWVIGWSLILEYLFSAATVAVGWSGYFTAMMGEIGIFIPERLSNAPLGLDQNHDLAFTGAVLNLPACFIVLTLAALLVIGTRESARINNLMVLLKLAVIISVIGFGAFYIDQANWRPFIPENTGTSGHYGWSGIVRGAGVVFFAYIGFDAISTAAQEARNPQRDMPIAMIASLLICTALYIGMALVLTGLAPYQLLDVPHPVFAAIDQAGQPLAWLKPVINLGAMAGLASVIIVLLMGQSRIFYTMSKDGLISPLFSAIHSKFRTPYFGTAVVGGSAALIAGLFPIDILGELVSIGTLFAFVIVCGGVLVLRRTAPEIKRPFQTPWVPFVPVLGILICGYMMYSLPPETWIRLILWLAIGLAVYFFYGKSHSRLAKQ